MKKRAFAVMIFTVVASGSAWAGNNPLIDKALLENLAEKESFKELRNDEIAKDTEELNARYRAVEVLELGDELGGFAGKDLAKDELTEDEEEIETK